MPSSWSTVIFTAFGDRLTVRPATGGDSFEVIGPFAQLLEGETDNICLRAVRGYRAAGGEVGPLAMTLEKISRLAPGWAVDRGRRRHASVS